METLRGLGLLKSRFCKRLPPEVWDIVITLLLDHLRVPYDYCIAELFPFYQIQMYRIGSNIIDESDWRRVRLVCRLWAVLAGPRRVFKYDSRTRTIPQGVTILHCEVQYPWHTFVSQLVSTPELGRWLTTLSIFEKAHRQPQDQQSAIVPLLLAGSAAFPNLRSLSLSPSIFTSEEHLPQFWSQLEAGFPLLISLALASSFFRVLPATVTFPALEILDMSSYSFVSSHPFIISLPSLKHLSISRVVGPDPILLEHSHQLESLLIHGPTAELLHRESFWQQVPNLRMLGAPLGDIERMKAPPQDHPLRHICVFTALEEKNYLVRSKCLLEAFPRIHSFSYFQQRLSRWDVRSLGNLADRKGVRLRQLPVLFPISSNGWLQIATILYFFLFMLPLSAFRLIRQTLGFRW